MSQRDLSSLNTYLKKVRSLVNRALDSFARFDVEAALAVAQEDAEVDKYYASAIRSLITYMAEDPAQISRMLNLLWGF
jgi:phosphate transport system protein